MAKELSSKQELFEKDRPEDRSENQLMEDLFDPTVAADNAADDDPFEFSRNTATDATLIDRIVVLKTSGLVETARQRYDIDLNAPETAGGAILHRLVTFTSGDATPSVANANVFITAGTTAITDFDDGQVGQIIHIKATDSITITDGAPIVLAGSVNYDMTDTDTLTLAMFDDQVWHEISRSVN